jgi:N-acetylneuraminic acid mutarotase
MRGHWILLGLVGLSIVVIVVKLTTGVGPDLPGEELGLVGDPARYEPCTLQPGEDRTPALPSPAAGHWREEPPIPVARDELRGVTIDRRILLANGHELSEDGELLSTEIVESFDPARDTYETLRDSPIPLDHAVAVAYEDDLYLAGGYSSVAPTDRLWRYSPQNDRWRELPPMRVARYSPAGAVIGHRLYVVGGGPGEQQEPYSSMEVYDFKSRRWVAGPDMSTGRHHHSAVALDGQLYVVGGRQPGDFSLDSFERFDPESGEWEELPPLPQGTGGNAAVATENEVVVIGGGDDLGSDGSDPWVTGAVWAFNPKTGRWRRLPDLSLPRHGHAAAVANGRIYALGGAPCPLFGRTSDVESLGVR